MNAEAAGQHPATGPWPASELFAGPGETLALLRQTDWSATPLGPVESWPVELRAAIRTVLPSQIPMLLWWGPQLVQIFNQAYTPVLGDKFPAAAGQSGAQCWAEVWDALGPLAEQVLSGGGATYSENQLLFLHRHGYREETYWTFSYSPVRGEDDQVAGIFVATTDVTARVLGDRRLDTLRELGDLSIAGAATAADVCEAAVAVLARRSADLPSVAAYLWDAAGRLALVAGPGELGPAEQIRRVAETGEPTHVTGLDGPLAEAVLLPLQVSGRPRPAGVLAVAVSPYRKLDAPYRAFLGLVAGRVSTALTDALAYEAERRRAAALAELDTAKTAFFANVSHELRTPLTLITGPVEESLADEKEPLPPVQRDRLELVHRNAGRLRQLVNNLLDFARIEAGRLEAETTPTDLAALTRSIAGSFEFAMRRAGLAFVVAATPLPRTANVDPDMWEKIVVNLLSNALKYTLDGEVRLTLAGGPDEIELTVTDTGSGIAADELPLLFERFHRVRGGAGRSHEGSGIGLALVHELVKLHGGSVAVESVEGDGSAFTVRLPYGSPAVAVPRERAAKEPYAAQALHLLPGARVPAAGPAADSPTVLVVDDNADLRTFVTQLLAPHYRVEAAADGQDALARIAAHLPDLVLTDVMMPVLDGFGLVEALRGDSRTARIPVVVLSARAGAESAADGLAAGADDYLAKPFSSLELIARVRANLELARLRNAAADWRAALTGALQEAFFIADESGTLIEVNDAFRLLVGSVDAGDRPWWPGALDEGRSVIELTHADGHAIWAEAAVSAVADELSGQRVYVGTLRDVTEDRLAAVRQAALAGLSGRLAELSDVSSVLSVARATLGRFLGDGGIGVLTRGVDGEVVALSGRPPAQEQAAARALAGLEAGQPVHVESDASGRIAAAGIRTGSGESFSAVWLELDPPRALPAAEQSHLLLMTSTVAHAVQRAQTFDQQRTVALTLQRSILGPVQLPPGFAVRYEPAVAPLEVGGDWYDVVPLPGDAVGVVVGDCVGRGLDAAAVMGQLRSACRALLLQAKGPADVVAALDDFARLIPGAACTTVFCAIAGADGQLRYSAAGHLPGIVVHADGSSDLLDAARSIPLATLPVSGRPEATAWLRPGSVLLLYTDGLVERRGEVLDAGIERVRSTVVSHRDQHQDALADEVMAVARPRPGHQDDVALLVYRHPDVDSFALAMPAAATELTGMRAALTGWLSRAGVSEDDAAAVLIATSEACANAIEHAYGFAEASVVDVSASVHAGQLEVVVRDSGRWVDPGPATLGRGRGRMMMSALMDRCTIDPGTLGTSVRFVKDIRHAE
jgi:signal transduction histidine kinase/CheY-like chemotaxis protein/serine phosphatase RsbU (regulator of sigma subunit)